MLRITSYAERLIKELEGLTGRRNQIVATQLDWPQRRCAREVSASDHAAAIEVLTPLTRFQTAVYLPEHPLVSGNHYARATAEVQAYQREVA